MGTYRVLRYDNWGVVITLKLVLVCHVMSVSIGIGLCEGELGVVARPHGASLTTIKAFRAKFGRCTSNSMVG